MDMLGKDLTFYFFTWLILRQLIFRAVEVMLSRNHANQKQNYLHNKFYVYFRGIYCADNFGHNFLRSWEDLAFSGRAPLGETFRFGCQEGEKIK